MNKTTLIETLANETGMSKAAATKAVDSAFGAIGQALAAGEKVSLPGFGSFEVRDRPARPGRNPQTGEALEIAASKAVGFKAGKTLKDSVNG